jgi:CheY-like chemotaxis protein
MARALVVEDDREIMKTVEDTLVGLGHEHDWADNLQDARGLLEANAYDYVLLDLQIPAQPNRGFAKIEHGRSMLDTVQQVKGKGRLPVIIMTGYHSKCLDQTTELAAAGASQFISKPFPEAGRTLASVILDVLAKHREKFPDAVPAGNQPPALAPFPGGVLAFYPDHVELRGETIVEITHRGHGWKILHLLREKNDRGTYVRKSGKALAAAVQRGLGQNTVAQCIVGLRRRITEIMRDGLKLDCGLRDVIDNRPGGGYCLSPKIVVEVHGAEAGSVAANATRKGAVTKPDVTASHVTADVTAPEENVTARPDVTARGDNVTANERQKWVLGELARDAKITRADVEKHFAVGGRTVKRDLKELIAMGLVEFVRSPAPGHYRLRQRRPAAQLPAAKPLPATGS